MLLQVLLSLFAIFAARVLWRRWRYDVHKIPSPAGLPFNDHTLRFINIGRPDGTTLPHLWNQMWRELKDTKIMRVSLMGEVNVVVKDMDFIRKVMFSKVAPFPKETPQPGGLVTMLGNDRSAKRLLETENFTPYVKAVRRVYANGLQNSVMKASLPKLDEVIRAMVQAIEDQREQGPIDFQELSVRMSLDAIGVLALDANLGGLDGSIPIFELLMQSGLIMMNSYHSPWKVFCQTFFQISGATEEEKNVIDSLTAEWDKLTQAVLKREDPSSGEDPIWHGLRSLTDPETGEKITYKGLRAEIATTVLAGMDTTGHQLAWIFSLLATHPEVAEKLLSELQKHGLHGDDARKLTFEDLSDLKFLTATIKEAMRIALSISAVTARRVPKDMTILGYRIPKGTKITVPSNRYMNALGDWGDDPDVFRPERWLDVEDMSQKHYLGFSYGPRDCVGQRLAMLELRVAVVELVKKYDFTPVTPFYELTKKCRNGVAVEARDGIWLHVTERKQEDAQ